MATGAKKEYSMGYIIGAQLKSSFPKAFKDVEKQLLASKKAFNNAKSAWGDFAANAGKLVVGVTGTAAGIGAAVWKMADDIAMTGDQAAKTAKRIKMDAETYQELQYAFQQCGLGADEFAGMMTRLNGRLINANKTAKSMEDFGEATGLDAKKLAQAKPEDQIAIIADYLNNLEDPIQKDAVAMELFGKSALEMQRVLEMGSDGIEALRKEAVKTGNVISNEVAAQAEEYASMKQRLTATISGIKVQLFSKLIPSFTEAFGDIAERLQSVDWAAWGEKIAGWVRDAVPKIRELAEKIGEFIGKIWNGIQAVKDFVGGWDKLAMIIGGILAFKTALSGIVAVINTVIAIKKAWAAIQAVVNAVMSANPIGLIIIAIVALIAIVVLLIKNWDKVKEVAGKVWDAIVGFVKGAVEKIKGFFAGVIDWVKTNWKAIVAFVINPFSGIFKYLYDNFEGFRNFVDNVVENIKAFFIGLWENIKGGVLAFVDAVVGFFTGLYADWVDIISALKEFFTGIWETVKAGVMEFIDAVIGFFAGFIEGIQEIIGRITGFFSDAWDKAKKLAKDFIDGVIKIFKPLTDLVENIGGFIKNIFGGKKTLEVDVKTVGDTAGALEGHARGGIFTRPHIARIAEAGAAEAVVPIKNDDSSRGIWEKAGQMAGFAQSPAGMSASSFGGLSVPVQVDIKVDGAADAETANRLKQAGADIGKQVRDMIYKTVPKVLDEMERGRMRTSFS